MREVSVTEQALTRGERRHVLRETWAMLRRQRAQIAMVSLFVVMQAASMLAGPAIVRWGIDSGVRAGDISVINQASLAFLVAALSAYVFGRQTIRGVARVGEAFLRQLRRRVFRHLMGLSMDFYERTRTGTLVSRMTADVEALQELVGQGLSMFLVNILLFCGAIVIMIVMSWQLALGTLVVVPMVVKASTWFRRESNRAFLRLRDRVGITLTSLQEGLSGIRVVQAFGQESAFSRRFSDTNEAQFEAHLHTEKIAAVYFPIIELAQGVAIAVILGLGGVLSARGAVTVGTVAAFVLYLQNLFEPVQQLSQLFNTLQASAAALHKLYELLDEEASIAERPGAIDLPVTGSLQVDGVWFTYEGADEPALRDVSIAVEPGRRLALVGPTGAGKSTLARLMARFHDPDTGTVRYAGVDLRDATLESLRARIALVPQEGFLFGGTIADNIRVGRPEADDAMVRRAVDSLGLTARFDRFPNGIESEVRERGRNLSAGERQLVSIVRAALADPAMIVLDEATSNLDPGTEVVVERAMERLFEGRTVVVIAHRLTTAARADEVAVIDGGRLLEIGTHDALLAREGAYAALYSSWAGSHTIPPTEPSPAASDAP